MKRRYLLVLALLAILVSQGLGIGPASAIVTTTYTGAIDSTDPQMEVVFISDPECTGQGTTLVHYEVIEFDDPEPGTHTFDLSFANPPSNLSLYLYEGSFDPLDGFANCVAATNQGPTVGAIRTKTLTYDFLDNTPYFLVVFDDSFDQLGGDYTVVAQSPDPPPTTTTTTTTTLAPTTTAAPTTTTVARPAPVAAAVAARPAFTG
jgi:hypothetical protein